MSDIRLICPVKGCNKEYKTYYWFDRHCVEKHGELLDPERNELVNKNTLDAIKDEITELKDLIKTLRSGTSTNEIVEIKNLIRNIRSVPVIHDIDIKGLKKPTPTGSIRRPPSAMDQCVKDLKNVFAQGLNILENMEKSDMMVKAEVIKKTEKELEKAELLAIQRSQERLEKNQ